MPTATESLVFAFIHMEKAAGTTFTSILRRSFGARHCDVRGWRNAWVFEDDLFTSADLRRTRRIYWNLISVAGHGVRPFSDLHKGCPELRYYTILREPLARCASHYQYQIQVLNKSVPFEEWIEEERLRDLQTRKLAGTDDFEAARDMLEARVDCVGLAERYDESLVLLRRFFGDAALQINYRPENIASDPTVSRALLRNERTRALLVEANRQDLKLYRHVRDEIFPRQIEDYGPTLADDVAAFEAARDDGPPGGEPLRSRMMRRYVFQPAVKTWYRWAA
jgi:hypothetical protein